MEGDVKDNLGSLVALIVGKLSEKQYQNELDIESFHLYLSSLFPPKSLPNAVDVLITFQDINAWELWDYCQYETVECIANRYLPEDKEITSAINEHREIVNNYLATQCIADYIEEESSGRDPRVQKLSYHSWHTNMRYYDTLSLKIEDTSIQTKTLKYVHDLWKKLKKTFCLPDCNTLLDHIYDGVTTVWLIPPSASEAVQRPQPWSTIHFLQQMLIVRMVLNDSCIYDIQVSWYVVPRYVYHLLCLGQQRAVRLVQWRQLRRGHITTDEQR